MGADSFQQQKLTTLRSLGPVHTDSKVEGMAPSAPAVFSSKTYYFRSLGIGPHRFQSRKWGANKGAPAVFINKTQYSSLFGTGPHRCQSRKYGANGADSFHVASAHPRPRRVPQKWLLRIHALDVSRKSGFCASTSQTCSKNAVSWPPLSLLRSG